MQPTTLEHVRSLVDQLGLDDQARLLEYLLPRITHAVAAEPYEAVDTSELPQEWQELFRIGGRIGDRIGDRIANLESSPAETLTRAVTLSRR